MRIKAISLWQPWASLVAIGAKQFETRGWWTNYRGPLAIHAAKRWTHEQWSLCQQAPFVEAFSVMPAMIAATCGVVPNGKRHTLPLGCIVATCELVGCRIIDQDGTLSMPEVTEQEYAFGNWSPGRYAWRLNNVRMLRETVPWKGRQGFFWVELPEAA